MCCKLWKFQTRIQQSSSHRFIERQTPSERRSFSGSAVTPLTQTCHTNCPCKAVWWNFIRVSLSPCILSWNQNNFRGSFRPRLHSVNLSKVSKSESNESSFAVDFEPSEASCCDDKAASERSGPCTQGTHMINHLTDVSLLCLCVWFAFPDQGSLFQRCALFFLSH